MTTPAKKKYTKGNTRVMIDLGPYYDETVAQAVRVDLPLGQFVKRAAITFLRHCPEQPLIIIAPETRG